MARQEKTITVVDCIKIGAELPALEKPPFPGPLGQRIYDNISQLAWQMWSEQSTLIINHYGLNMADPQSQEFMFEQLENFLFEDAGEMPGLGGPPAKGGGAPRK
jgi:Fe-S cluster biosynthesis and repair protein YggX